MRGLNVNRKVRLLTLVLLVSGGLLGLVWVQMGDGPAQVLAAPSAPTSLEGSTKTASSAEVLPGGTLRYNVILHNSAATATGLVEVFDVMPVLISAVTDVDIDPFTAGTFTCDTAACRTITFTIGTVPPNSNVTLTIDTVVSASEPTPFAITNTAVISNAGTSFTRSVVVQAPGLRYVYLPLVMKRFPPVPYPPVLQVTSNDNYGNYTLAWTYPFAQYFPSSYRFQESTDPDFTTLTRNEILASPVQYVSKAVGTYYYRVAGINADGLGEWSNVVSVAVVRPGFFDDFSNTASGWPRTVYYRGTTPDGPMLEATYENSSYKMKMLLNYASLNNRRMGVIPAPWTNPYGNYDISVDSRFAQAEDQVVPPDGGKAGLMFAAKSDYTTIYVVEWNYNGDCAVSRYTGVTRPTTIIDFSKITYYRGWGRCDMLRVGYDKVNQLKAEVRSGAVKIFINGVLVSSFTDSAIGGNRGVGLINGSWDRTPVEARFDNFWVEPK